MDIGKATCRIELDGIDEAIAKLQELESKIKSIRAMCPCCPCWWMPWYPPVNVPFAWIDCDDIRTTTSTITESKEE